MGTSLVGSALIPVTGFVLLQCGLPDRIALPLGKWELSAVPAVDGPSLVRLGSPMALLDYAGYAAAVCTTGAYVPQVLRVWRTRSTQDISLKMFLVLVTGLALWLTYGIWKSEIPLIAANSITLVLASTILCFKLKHG